MGTQNQLYHVYIIRSVNNPKTHYTGFTRNFKNRLPAHNTSESSHTSKYRPWFLETINSFRDDQKAKEFELYLKSHSGRAFSTKHFQAHPSIG